MKVESVEELISLFDKKINEMKDPSIMIYFLLLRQFDFDIKQLIIIRNEVENQIQNSVIQKIRSNSPNKKPKRKIDDDMYKYNPDEIQNFLVLQYNEPIEIIDNYCKNYESYEKDINSRLSIKCKNEIWNEMLVYRNSIYDEDDEYFPSKLHKNISLKSIFKQFRTSKTYLSLIHSFKGI